MAALESRCVLIPIFALVLLLLGCTTPAEAQSGVCYGLEADDLPSPQQTVSLYKQNNIRRMRTYDANPSILHALAGSGIELVVAVPNGDQLRSVAASQANAASWLQQNVRPHPDVNFRYIVMGNGIRPNNSASSTYAPILLPAMQNMQAAVAQAGLSGQIKVSTPFDYGILSVSYPPSAGKFDDQISSFLNPILEFLSANNAPLVVGVFPYLSYNATLSIRLDYALFTAPGTVMTDQGLQYANLFDAMVDAIYSALERAGRGGMTVVVSETGWPTAGGKGTNVDNARTYINNLLRHVKVGTPKKRGRELETYIFAIHDENRKSPELEKHWGLFSDLQAKYKVNF